jgi:hypothetical protein
VEANVPLSALSEILWRERELLEQLLFRLEVEQLLLVSGRTVRLPMATRDVELVLDRIRAVELGRAVEFEAAARALGLVGGGSLQDLAGAAPEPWEQILRDHRVAFLRLTAEVADLAEGNRDLLASSRRATQEALIGLGESLHGDDPAGMSTPVFVGSALLDESS